MEELKAIFTRYFKDSPNLHCELKSRIVLNDSILDEEIVTSTGRDPRHAVAIYHFKDNLISKGTFTR